MAERILFPEFRDELAPTKYPFRDGASLTSNTAQTIDPDTFLDASLYPIGSVDGMFIAQIEVAIRNVTITLGDRISLNLATAEFAQTTPPTLLRFTDDVGRPAGVLVSAPLRLARFGAWSTAIHTFARPDTQFVASVSVPTPEIGVRGILTENDELFTGDIWLVGDNGVVLRDDAGDIRVDIVGDPLFVRQVCEELGRFNPPRFIKTINGCLPDDQGNFNLTVGDHEATRTVVRIYPTDNGLTIEAVGQTNEGR